MSSSLPRAPSVASKRPASNHVAPTLPPATIVDLDQIAALVAAHLHPLADARGQTLTLATSAAPVSGGADDLERLVRNLVENAIRYTPEHGTITLTVRRDGARALLLVEDTGPGIDAAALPHLFDRFTRADRGRNRAAGGTGLGLAIAQAIAHRHGGTIRVTSTVGVGSAFIVALPLAHIAPAALPDDGSSTPSGEES